MTMPDNQSAALDAYRIAAAVLAQYDPATLNPLGDGSPDPQALPALIAESIQLIDPAGRVHWMLRHAIRRDVLRRLGTRTAMQAALAANPARPRIPLQEMLEAAIEGRLPALDQLNADQLTALLQITAWLGDILDDLPESGVVRAYADRAQLLAPLVRLVGSHFRGRAMELHMLHDYAGIKTQARFDKRPPLLIYGPGGTGKSSLLAHFILASATSADPASRPLFVFLDFDRSSLLAEEPIMLLAEAVRQIGIQQPRARGPGAELRSRWLHAPARSMAPPITQPDRRTWREGQAAIAEFGAFINAWLDPDPPLLFVLDQFEEVQYRSAEALLILWEFLQDLRQAMPTLCIMVASRAPVAGVETEELYLSELDAETAITVLEAFGVADQQLAQRIVEQVGGNPLSLRLAATLLQRGERLPGLTFDVTQNVQSTQGLLYRRIVDHIHSPDVRRLVSPGMVLRQITPALIMEVLAGPCGIQIDTAEQAERLFEDLRREVAVVTIDQHVALRFRVDVRQSVLRFLHQDDPATVVQIHQNAIAYYQQQDDIVSRAEEIYHRLFVDADFSLIEQRWIDGIEHFLYSALDEIPTPGHGFLAARLGIAS